MYQFNSEKFSEKLKKEIEKKGFNQQTFAEESGVPYQTLRSYLKSTMPKAEHLLRIAKTLNTNIEYLLENEGNETETEKTITPQDIINSINTLIEAYGQKIIQRYVDDNYDDEFYINISDNKIQFYLKQLKEKGFLKQELTKVGENETYSKLLKEWANIDGCIFEKVNYYDKDYGFIYNPQFEYIEEDEKNRSLYIAQIIDKNDWPF